MYNHIFYLRALIVLFCISIIIALATSLYHIFTKNLTSGKAVRTLTVRVGLSVGLFGVLFVGMSQNISNAWISVSH